jgi:uncharacterized membrane protein
MGRYKVILFIIILIVSLLILVDKIFTTAPIQIVLESGQEITTQNSNYYTLTEMLLLVVCAFMTGLSAVFLYHSSGGTVIKEYFLSKKKQDELKENLISNLLKDDEKRIYKEILDSNGEILQNRLVQKTNLSKVKVTRIIHRLAFKGLVVKERHGLTNKIKLKEPSALSGAQKD